MRTRTHDEDRLANLLGIYDGQQGVIARLQTAEDILTGVCADLEEAQDLFSEEVRMALKQVSDAITMANSAAEEEHFQAEKDLFDQLSVCSTI